VGAVFYRDKKRQDNRMRHTTIMIKIYLTIAISIVVLFSHIDCEANREFLIEGRTMGTTYSVKIVTGDDRGVAGLKEKIDARLVEINDSMSTYKKDSEITRFNNLTQVDRQFRISEDFYRVMMTARTLFELSEGAWDGTVNPLVDLWGFGRTGRKNKPPERQEIDLLLPQIGFEKIQILPDRSLIKKKAPVTLDLSSIAKGYGVDQVAQILRKAGYINYLVEIGGEISASGKRRDGKLWRIGINRPRKDAGRDEVYKVIDLENQAFATSGDYRNFFEIDGVRYSHIIDPRTGYPISNGVVSVSIIAGNCAFADGLATAVMIMGYDKGIKLISRLDAVEGLIVVERPDGSLADYFSRGFSR
jgi:thiamine biosynthesis lipoprotein